MRNKNENGDDDEAVEPSTKRQKNNKGRRVEATQTKAENNKFEGELDTTDKGLLRFNGKCGKQMDEKEKELCAVEHGKAVEKVVMSKVISVKIK
jgi:hypothetical protein